MSNLRPATQQDAAELAILDDIASSGLATWIWHDGVLSEKTDTAMEQGRKILGDPKVYWGFSNAVIGEIDNQVSGMAISYKMNMPDKNPDLSDKANRVLEGSFDLMRFANGHWYLDGLAVYRQNRKSGLGRELLRDAMDRGRLAGVSHISLITESTNERAQALYQSEGFKVVDQRPYIPFNQRKDIENWQLMTAPLH